MHVIRRFVILLSLLSLLPAILPGQQSFTALVDRTIGSDQVLINGVQFSNQYIRIEGSPYWMEGGFHIGSVSVNGQWYEQVLIRYNLYSQKVELLYWTPEGDLNQIITVAEQMPAFFLEAYEFRRMQLGDEAPAYYQFVSSGSMSCYVGWTMEVLGGGSSESRFGPPKRKYWMQNRDHGRQSGIWMAFHNRRTYVRAFPPEWQTEFKSLLKQENFSFKHSTRQEMTNMIKATIRLYETLERP